MTLSPKRGQCQSNATRVSAKERGLLLPYWCWYYSALLSTCTSTPGLSYRLATTRSSWCWTEHLQSPTSTTYTWASTRSTEWTNGCWTKPRQHSSQSKRITKPCRSQANSMSSFGGLILMMLAQKFNISPLDLIVRTSLLPPTSGTHSKKGLTSTSTMSTTISTKTPNKPFLRLVFLHGHLCFSCRRYLMRLRLNG